MTNHAQRARSAVPRALAAHRSEWGDPEFVARAPGRVNLIGEHTDYNDGFVLPMAIGFDTAVVVSRAPSDAATEIRSEGFGSATLDPNQDRFLAGDWALYLRGVHKLMTESGQKTGPWRATIATDIPTGASLSSSAALEVATIRAMLHLAGTDWSPSEVALLGQRVENEIVGVPSGIMDQLISAAGVAGHASLVDCQSLEITLHPVPSGSAVVVMDTNTRRKLADSAFADRQATCASAAEMLGVASLRLAALDDLDRLGSHAELERRRATHVISENGRTLAAAAAMSQGEAERLGALMSESHRSLRDDYEVSGDALDTIVEVAQSSPGCLGARMTGGGFAGCAVALVRKQDIGAFSAEVADGYERRSGRPATLWVCEAAQGASIEPVS